MTIRCLAFLLALVIGIALAGLLAGADDAPGSSTADYSFSPCLADDGEEQEIQRLY